MNVFLMDMLADLSAMMENRGIAAGRLLTIMGLYVASLLLFTGLRSQLRARLGRRRWRYRIGIERKAASVDTVSLLVKLLTRFNKKRSDETTSRMRRSLVQAGYYGRNAPIIFLNLRFFTAISLAGLYLTLYLPRLAALSSSMTLLFTVLLAGAGFLLPDLWLKLRIKSRQQQIMVGFPDALDLMVVCVEAGLGLNAAIHRVGQEIAMNHKALSEEFQLVDFALRVGQNRAEALQGMGTRTGLDDINSFVTLITQTEKFGGSVAPALRVHADAMRTQRQQRAEEAAAKLPVKLLIPLIFFIFPSLFVAIAGPVVLQIFDTLAKTH